MLKGQNIIYFSNDWDADNRTSSHHIAKQLCRFNRLLYVEASGLRAPKITTHDVKRGIIKIKNFLIGLRRLGDSVYVYTPLVLPFHRHYFMKKINRFLLINSLKRICKKLKFNDPILWIIIPHMSSVVGNLKEKLVVYYCVDDFSSLPSVESGAIAQIDGELTKKADIIFTPSEPLYLKKKKYNKNTFLRPHGVDFEHFSRVVSDNLPLPDDISFLKKPIIGFFGLIEKWIDLDLISYIAKSRPEWEIVLIGRIAHDISTFDYIPNVYFLGPRKYELLPCYAKAFDVTIIPYVLNKQVINANPIKLREYLAMGKPVVSVRTPEIEKFSDVVKISDNYKDFVNNIEVELNEDSNEKVRQRVERVKDSSWEKSFEIISDNMAPVLNQNINSNFHNCNKKDYISKYGIANDICATIQRQLKDGEEKRKKPPAFLNEIISVYSKRMKVLDVGCGVGSDLRILFENGFDNVYGMDIVFEAIVNAQKFSIKKVLQANCEEIPFKSNSIDLCIAKNIIEHILNPLSFLKEINRVLKPDGIVYLTAPRAASVDDRILRWGGMILHGRSSHIQKFNLTRLYDLFKETNFKVMHCKEIRGAELNFPALKRILGFSLLAKILRWFFRNDVTDWNFMLKKQ